MQCLIIQLGESASLQKDGERREKGSMLLRGTAKILTPDILGILMFV